MPVQPQAGIPPQEILRAPAMGPSRTPLLPNFYSNYPSSSGFGANFHILLLSVCAILLIVVFFLVGTPFGTVKKSVGEFVAPINVLDVKFSSNAEQERFLKNFQEAARETDYDKRYVYLETNFTALRAIYISDHDSTTRGILLEYAEVVNRDYPDKYKANFSLYTVPCLDEDCGDPQYPAEIKKIIEEIETGSGLSEALKAESKRNLEAAVLSEDKDEQFSNYLSVFELFHSLYSKNKDSSSKNIAVQIKEFLKANYPETYTFFENSYPEKFSLD